MSCGIPNANDRLLPSSQAATIRLVVDFNSPLARFFAASLVLHLLAFMLFAWPRPKFTSAPQDSIKVSLLPEQPLPEPLKAQETPAPGAKPPPAAKALAPRRASRAPAIVARKNSPASAEKHSAESVRPNPQSTPREFSPSEISREDSAPRKPVEEPTVIVEHPLPTLKELLPSVTYSVHEDGGPEQSSVSLNTRDPKYITYVGKIRQSIESEWQYPEIALRYGLQGKLALEFTILGNGQLEGLRLVRSSGSSLLDDEALRAIKAAAPFPPIPPWIKPNPLRISATMEYRDSRLDYRFMR
jgi:protein TonB